MAISEILGFLSLTGYVALFGLASWKTWMTSKVTWDLDDHGFDKVAEVVKYALRFSLNRGVVVIAEGNSDCYVLFQQYILSNGEYALEFGFPDAEWSTTHASTLRSGLAAERIAFREVFESYGEVNAFIHVDCGQDVNKAVGLARRCFFDLFGLASDSRFKSSPLDCSTVHEDVDNPEFESPAVSEFWRGYRDQWQWEGKGRPDYKLTMRAGAFGIGFVICCYPALWGAWFFANTSPPDWQWSVGSIQLAGSHATWIILLIFCVMLVGARRDFRELRRAKEFQISRPKPEIEIQIDRIAKPLIYYALPLAVIASWIGM